MPGRLGLRQHRRHQLQVALQLDLGRVEAGARWQYGSGLPYTRPYGFDVVVPPFGLPEVTTDPGYPRVVFERPFNGRLPSYHRLDLSAGTDVRLGEARLECSLPPFKGGTGNWWPPGDLLGRGW